MTPRELAQRIAEIHPPVSLRLNTDTPSGQNYVCGAWQADRCPQWIKEITELIADRDAEQGLLTDRYMAKFDEMSQQLVRLEETGMPEKIVALRKALWSYGTHDVPCPTSDGGVCTCGLEKAREL